MAECVLENYSIIIPWLATEASNGRHPLGKHGFTLDDVLWAANHLIKMGRYMRGGELYVKFTGHFHGDALVHSLEVIMKSEKSGRLVVFHVNAEQQGFWDTD